MTSAVETGPGVRKLGPARSLALVLFTFLTLTMVQVAVPLRLGELGVSGVTLGVLLALPSVTGLAAETPFASLSDVAGRAGVISLGAVIVAVSSVALATVSGVWLFAGALVLYGVGLVTAALTAFYMFRAVYLTFHGKFRGTPEQEHHLHESPPVMTLPLWILAVGAVVSGWVGFPGWNLFHHFLEPVVRRLIPERARCLPHAVLTARGILVVVLQAGVVAATSRVAGLETSGAAAAGISALALAAAGVLLAPLLLEWRPSERRPVRATTAVPTGRRARARAAAPPTRR